MVSAMLYWWSLISDKGMMNIRKYYHEKSLVKNLSSVFCFLKRSKDDPWMFTCSMVTIFDRISVVDEMSITVLLRLVFSFGWMRLKYNSYFFFFNFYAFKAKTFSNDFYMSCLFKLLEILLKNLYFSCISNS